MMEKALRSPWATGWREKAWAKIQKPWDVIVVGGGITGAGILAAAVRSGLSGLLVEKDDFAAGTSSRSSKLVHGGLRYLKHMQVKLTRESVLERQSMLRAAPGLVEPLGFVYPVYEGGSPGPWAMQLGLGIYTRLAPDAGRYKRLDRLDISLMAPGLRIKGLKRGFHYVDAQTDDARLVLRILHDALAVAESRAAALNYCRVAGLVREDGQVKGVTLRDEVLGETLDVRGRVVVNATGVWSDELRREVGGERRLRPLRGSHLYFPLDKLPVYQSIAFSHPDDDRPVFVYPWEGVTLVGTTDVDHDRALDDEPFASAEEADYLMRAARFAFPELDLRNEDVLSTQAGVRPVVDTGKKDPSAESREHVVWTESGLLTVTGGKLTTFRLIAVDALREAHRMDKEIPEPPEDVPVFEAVKPLPVASFLDPACARRLGGRYGRSAASVAALSPELLSPVEGTPYLRAEVVWSAANEAVVHLDDLLLRRFRLGILLPDGGQSLCRVLRTHLQSALLWSGRKWDEEFERYRSVWQRGHGLPDGWKKAPGRPG